MSQQTNTNTGCGNNIHNPNTGRGKGRGQGGFGCRGGGGDCENNTFQLPAHCLKKIQEGCLHKLTITEAFH